ncbi:TPA: hypothetical protein H1005_00535 [archaeon]|uniref:Uncharacterized protein n=1 Tax=Candidatus Naiadarchaeum limnaeum TaxID=2756139 RepID=A0A832V159_9ARCH|nr:hypothetical protein [Candidatus Naiadarchaeales archaeon SRR2090153.bin1042]HIK00063.1 hypothetical protein [Candidatus Naiadarchaeum limnaeum]
MSKKTFPNRKAQFFIASAVIIIFVVTAVFFFVAKIGQITNPALLQREMSFFALNTKEEFGKVVEISLSDVSRDTSLDPNTYLDANLSSFSKYIQAQGLERGIIVNASATRVSASNSSMNASLYLSLFSQGSNLETNAYLYHAITTNALNGTLVTTPTCTLNVTVKKEFGEPITELNSSNFVFKINGTTCSTVSYDERSRGKYNATCSSSTCPSSTVRIEVTEHRNIFGFSTIPNTGLGNGCAANCGQPID